MTVMFQNLDISEQEKPQKLFIFLRTFSVAKKTYSLKFFIHFKVVLGEF